MSRPHSPAKRSLGQNFLVDPNLQRKIVAALEPDTDAVVLEIGPGRGALTDHLVGTAGRLVVVELDDDLAAALAATHAERPDVRVVHGDALDVPLEDLAAEAGAGPGGARELRVVGNIPYNITSPLIFRLLEPALHAARIVLMVQKEVADRLAAAPGTSAFGALTVGVQTAARVERLFTVGRGAFRPVPGVDSAVVRLTPHRPALLRPHERADLRALTRAAFGRRRKQLQKILRTAPEYALEAPAAEAVLADVGVRPDARPETVAPPLWIDLARALRARQLPRTEESNG